MLSKCLATLALVTVALSACNDEDDDASRRVDTGPDPAGDRANPEPAIGALKRCLRDKGSGIRAGAKRVPDVGLKDSSQPFTATFPDSRFGPQVDDVAFLPYAQQPLTKRALARVRPRIKRRRRVIRRSKLLVIFGVQNTKQVNSLVTSCVGTRPPKEP